MVWLLSRIKNLGIKPVLIGTTAISIAFTLKRLGNPQKSNFFLELWKSYFSLVVEPLAEEIFLRLPLTKVEEIHRLKVGNLTHRIDLYPSHLERPFYFQKKIHLKKRKHFSLESLWGFKKGSSIILKTIIFKSI